MYDTTELRTLAADLDGISSQSLVAVRDDYKQGARDLRDKWRENARQTAGKHGRHYPQSITDQEMVGFNLTFEVGPETRLRQGSMGLGFEYGSVNQPPHLDGNRAADVVAPDLERAVAKTLEGLF